MSYETSFEYVKIHNVPMYKSGMIEAKHGFSTRAGGVSSEPHLSSLNLGFGLGDSRENVEKNRAIFAKSLGIDPETIVSAKQIHSGKVFTVGRDDIGRVDFEGDGLVTNEAGVALMTKVADCTPILLCDMSSGVIGAVHAGWRGTSLKIAPEAVGAMEKLGASRENIKVAIGPCIGFCCYEVDETFFQTVSERLGDELALKFVRAKSDEGVSFPAGKYHADIAGLNRELLIRSGIKPENIDVCHECTCHRPDVFFSHRGSHGKRGVMGAMISL